MDILRYYLSDINNESQAYSRIRKAVGYCGFIIPTLCLLLALTSQCSSTLLPSISHYYYTIIGDIFSAVLFALGLFLLLYRSVFQISHFRRWENRITNLAGLMAWIVAFIPTDPEGGDCYFIALTHESYLNAYGWWGNLHLPAAGIMIISFGVISAQFFPRNWKTGQYDSDNKKIYKACGYTIFISIGILILYFADSKLLDGKFLSKLEHIKIVFLMECVAVFAFAISWLKKGRAVGGLLHAYESMKKSSENEIPTSK